MYHSVLASGGRQQVNRNENNEREGEKQVPKSTGMQAVP